MTEKQIEKQAEKWFKMFGWTYWKPVKSKWGIEKDIFGVYDMIAARQDEIKFVQLTSWGSNVSKRINKVQAFLDRTKVTLPSEVWGWDKKNNYFRMIKL